LECSQLDPVKHHSIAIVKRLLSKKEFQETYHLAASKLKQIAQKARDNIHSFRDSRLVIAHAQLVGCSR